MTHKLGCCVLVVLLWTWSWTVGLVGIPASGEDHARYRYWEEGGRIHKRLDREPMVFYYKEGSPKAFTEFGYPPKRVWFKDRKAAQAFAYKQEHGARFVPSSQFKRSSIVPSSSPKENSK